MKKPTRKYLKRTLAAILVFVMVFSSMLVSVPVSYAEDVAPTTVTYDFHYLGLAYPDGTLQETQVGWSVKEKYDPSLALSPQPYGTQVENDASTGWVSFNFDVSAAGSYEVSFLGALAGGGGLTDIIVDGSSVGQYDFYSAEYVPAGELKSLQIVNLTAGTHELKMQATGAANGAWSYRMYPTKMVITPSVTVPQELVYDFHKLGLAYPDGTLQETQVGWSVKEKYDPSLALSPQPYGAQVENDASTGWVTFNFDVSSEGSYEVSFLGALAGGGGLTDIIVDGSNVGQYDFYSAEYVPAGELKSLKVINLTAGTHELKMQATGVANGAWSYRMYPTEMVLTPSEPVPQELLYDFHKLGLAYGDGTLQETQEGWSVKEKYDPSLALSAQPYGTQIENDASTGWASFNFDVSAEGWYKVAFLGALAGGGGLTDIIVDGTKVGQYDFYSAEYVPVGELKSLQVINLTAGTHELKMQATGVANGAWSYRMYPTEMVLTPSEPVPQELVYDFHKLGIDGQETQEGWRVIPEECNVSDGYYASSYGLQVENYSADDRYMTFEFNVPQEGYYLSQMSSLLYANGGIVDAIIDGVTIGKYDFFSSDTIATYELKDIGSMKLTAGYHKLKLLVSGTSGSYYCMYPTQFVLVPTEEPVVSDIIYDFHMLGLPGQGTQEGWSIVPELSNIPITDCYPETYGFHVENYATGNYITFEYDVPEEAIYRVSLSGGLYAGGAVTDVLIDGKPGGTFDFYGPNVPDSGLKTMKTLTLTKGKHTITVKAIGQTSPSWGYCMYLGKLVLKKVDTLPNLTDLIFRLNSETLVRGQSTKITLLGELDDGTLNALEDAEVKICTSDNESVATVDNDAGVVSAGLPGTANITAHVTLRGVSIEKTIAVIVLSDVLDSVELVVDKTTLVENTTCGASIKALLTNGKPALLNDAVIDLTSDNEDVIWPTTDTIYAYVPGEANVQLTLTLGDVTKTYSIKFTVIKKALSSVELLTSDNISDVLVGKTKQLSVKAMYNNDIAVDFSKDNAIVAYDSKTPDVASVDAATGVVTALTEGTAIINVDVTIDGVTQSDTITLVVYSWENATNKKTKISLYTPEKIANARANIANYEWAKAAKDSAVAAADEYLKLGNDFWWNIVTSQNIPRSYSVNQEMKCPICGDDIYKDYGNYPWIIDPVYHPWKLICPKSGEIFPSNDFEAYYKGGLDENGNFDPAIAKSHNDELIANGGAGNLVNVLYPDKPADWCVDDGYGAYADDKSQKLLFIAYYDHWGLWYKGFIQNALDAFRDAYLYTGEDKYAHMGTILLDRIADVYPEMDTSVYKKSDGFLNSDGNNNGDISLGKVLGSIWETVLVPSFIRAYDAFYPAMDDADTISFLEDKAAQYNLDNPKVSVSAIRKNIEDGILRQVLPGVKNCQLEGNTGMEQSCIALAAVVFDSLPETKELIDFNFSERILREVPRSVTGGGLLPILVNNVDRDGQGNECAPGYNYLWLQQLRMVADVMDGYTLDGLDASADLYKNPKFIKMFKAFYPLILSGRYTAAIGDTGGTGTAGIIGSLEDCVKGFEKTGDHVIAQVAYYLNHNKADGLHGDIFSAEPEKVANDIKAAIEQYGELKLDSTNLTGFGFAALRDGENFIKDAGIAYNFSDMSLLQHDTDFGYYSSSGTMQFNAMVDGLTAKFSFDVAKADTYEIDLRTYKATSYGIYDIFIDDQKINTYDFYGTTGAGNFEAIGNMQLSEGTHTITFTGNGRNPANTEAYKMGVIQLSLLDAEAQEIKRISEEKGDTQRDAWMYYGHNRMHGHSDTLNLGMHAFGIDIAPELGYPEYTGDDPMRNQWVNNTISHNTVVVDKAKQMEQLSGTPLHFDDSTFVKLMDVDASKAYPQTDMYRRTTALIKVDDNNSYAIDLFRIAGGTDHNFSFHSNEGIVTTEGLNLVHQDQGTYAGPDIAYAESYDDTSAFYMGSGFQYLKNVDRDTNPAGQFSVDWKIDPSRSPLPIEQDVHLKLTMLTPADDVALADGVPPQRPGNPETLKYLVVHKKGANLNSLFASVLQPYKDSPFIDSISNVEISENGAAVADGSAYAVKVVLKNGRTDYIVNALDSTKTYIVDSKIQFKGFFGVYSEQNGQQVYGYVNDGTVIGRVVTDTGSVSGTVTDFTRELSDNNEITVQLDSADVDLNNLSGRFIYIENDGLRNASYLIKSASKIDDTHVTLNLGDTTLIRSYTDTSDFSKGYIYDVAAGSKFVIPLSSDKTIQLTEVNLTADKTELTRAQTVVLNIKGKLNTGDDADLSNASIEYFSSDPNVAMVENGVVTAYNAGSADIYVKVTLNGVTVQSNTITIKVNVSLDSISYLIDLYQESGDLISPLVPQITNMLDQARHQFEMGKMDVALQHMQVFLRHLNNKVMQPYISAEAKAALNADANTLINDWNTK